MIGLLAILLADQQTIWGRDAGVPFLIGLLSIKLLELRATRDFIIVSFLCYFLVVGALLFSQAIFMCLYLFSVMVVITAGLIKLHLGQESKALLRPSYPLACRLLLQALPLALALSMTRRADVRTSSAFEM